MFGACIAPNLLNLNRSSQRTALLALPFQPTFVRMQRFRLGPRCMQSVSSSCRCAIKRKSGLCRVTILQPRAKNLTTTCLRHSAGSASSLPPADDTIYALSTAQGRAGIAVIRISGPSCIDVSLCHFHGHSNQCRSIAPCVQTSPSLNLDGLPCGLSSTLKEPQRI